MKRAQANIFILILTSFLTPGIILPGCKRKAKEGLIILTEFYGGVQTGNPDSRDPFDQELKSRLISLRGGKAGQIPVVITQGFFSARSPEISSDGTKVLFTARKSQNDKWQIWEIKLNDLKPRQIVSLPENCIDPAYLPTGRIIFSKHTPKSDLNGSNAIFSCNPDGSDIRQATFNPHRYKSLTVLRDGRVLAISKNTLPETGDEAYMVMRPDGTKNELFYKGAEGTRPGSPMHETSAGRMVFIESVDQNNNFGNIVSVDYNQPFHSYVNHTSDIEGEFNAVFPLNTGKFLVSYRKSENEHFGLYEFDPDSKSMGQIFYPGKESEIGEVVSSQQHERARKLPSEVDMGVKTGLILCQDINYFDNKPLDQASASPKAVKVRIEGRDSTLGEVDVEKDGSFYLKVIADTPFRIETVDDKGRILCKSCDWVYLRPNERRGCVGCHESQEIVPENKVSLAVRHAPVNIPVHINKVVEKKVSLE